MPNSSEEACTLEVRRKVVLRLSPSKTPPKIWVLHYTWIRRIPGGGFGRSAGLTGRSAAS